jgi:endogenous inhibitor of DNA gyrase (YacG/DUF329 family)
LSGTIQISDEFEDPRVKGEQRSEPVGRRPSEHRIACPTCGRPFDPRRSAAMPFCSALCRRIDLGRWIKEEIRMPLDGEAEE